MSCNPPLRAIAALVLACSCLAAVESRAGIITTFDELPPFGTYVGASHAFAEFVIAGAPFPITVTNAAHSIGPQLRRQMTLCPPVPLPCITDPNTPGFMQEHIFDSEGRFGVLFPGSTVFMSFTGITATTRVKLLSNSGGVKVYSNELVDLEFPMFDLGGVESLLREDQDAGKESVGITTIEDLGGGLFRIESFFDVFTELSLDRGLTWIDSSAPPGRVVLVPEPGTLVLVGFALALLGGSRRWPRGAGLASRSQGMASKMSMNLTSGPRLTRSVQVPADSRA